MWITLLAWTFAARAACTFDDLRTRVRLDDGQTVRWDSWTLYVDSGEVDCARLSIPDRDHSEIDHVSVRIRRVDDSHERLGRERLVRQEGGWALLLPELRHGDRVRVRLRRHHEGEWLRWVPRAEGTLELTAAQGPTVSGRTAAQVERARVGRRRWRWTSADPIELGEVPATDSCRPPETLEITHTLRWAPHGDEPATGSTFIEESRSVRAPAQGARFDVSIPADASEPWCRLGDQDMSVDPEGCVIALPPGDSALSWGWRQAGLLISGEHRLRSPREALVFDADQVQLDVYATFPREWQQDAGTTRFAAAVPLQADDGFAEAGAPRVSWRITRVGDEPVLTDRDLAVERVAIAALDASVPEPGAGLDFKHRHPDEAVVDELIAHLQRQVVEGSLPGQLALHPRKLTRARRSGWATPWEQALLLTRYLRQLKIDALPVPVRPLTMGDADLANPASFPRAVVRIPWRGGYRWIDPTCRVCGVGELSPDLWGGRALSAEVEALPAGLAGTWSRRVQVKGAAAEVVDVLSGTAALELRRALVEVPVERRLAWLAERGPGELSSVEGLAERGAAVTLRYVAPSADHLWAQLPPLSTSGSERIAWPFVGRVEWTGPGASAGRWKVEGAGAVWTRESDGEQAHEVLVLSHPLAVRADAVRFLEEIDQQREWATRASTTAEDPSSSDPPSPDGRPSP